MKNSRGRFHVVIRIFPLKNYSTGVQIVIIFSFFLRPATRYFKFELASFRRTAMAASEDDEDAASLSKPATIVFTHAFRKLPHAKAQTAFLRRACTLINHLRHEFRSPEQEVHVGVCLGITPVRLVRDFCVGCAEVLNERVFSAENLGCLEFQGLQWELVFGPKSLGASVKFDKLKQNFFVEYLSGAHLLAAGAESADTAEAAVRDAIHTAAPEIVAQMREDVWTLGDDSVALEWLARTDKAEAAEGLRRLEQLLRGSPRNAEEETQQTLERGADVVVAMLGRVYSEGGFGNGRDGAVQAALESIRTVVSGEESADLEEFLRRVDFYPRGTSDGAVVGTPAEEENGKDVDAAVVDEVLDATIKKESRHFGSRVWKLVLGTGEASFDSSAFRKLVDDFAKHARSSSSASVSDGQGVCGLSLRILLLAARAGRHAPDNRTNCQFLVNLASLVSELDMAYLSRLNAQAEKITPKTLGRVLAAATGSNWLAITQEQLAKAAKNAAPQDAERAAFFRKIVEGASQALGEAAEGVEGEGMEGEMGGEGEEGAIGAVTKRRGGEEPRPKKKKKQA